MILMLSAMRASPPYEIDESIKIPSGAICRSCLSIRSLNEAKAKIFGFIDSLPEPFSVIQADVLEGRKPNGFSEAVKDGVFGNLVFVTKNTRKESADGKKN